MPQFQNAQRKIRKIKQMGNFLLLIRKLWWDFSPGCSPICAQNVFRSTLGVVYFRWHWSAQTKLSFLPHDDRIMFQYTNHIIGYNLEILSKLKFRSKNRLRWKESAAYWSQALIFWIECTRALLKICVILHYIAHFPTKWKRIWVLQWMTKFWGQHSKISENLLRKDLSTNPMVPRQK
jgi:hypothetical protein